MVGWGIAIYAIMFLVWSVFVTYGFVEGVFPRIAGLLTLVAVTLIAGRSLRAPTWKDVLPYAAAWAVIIILCDMLLSVPFTGWQLFADWNVWVGYALALLVPLFAPYTRSKYKPAGGT